VAEARRGDAPERATAGTGALDRRCCVRVDYNFVKSSFDVSSCVGWEEVAWDWSLSWSVLGMCARTSDVLQLLAGLKRQGEEVRAHMPRTLHNKRQRT